MKPRKIKLIISQDETSGSMIYNYVVTDVRYLSWIETLWQVLKEKIRRIFKKETNVSIAVPSSSLGIYLSKDCYNRLMAAKTSNSVAWELRLIPPLSDCLPSAYDEHYTV